MKTEFKTVLAIGIGIAVSQCAAPAEDKQAFTNQSDKVSYSVGMYVGEQILKRNGIEVNVDVMTQAINDTLAGRELKLTPQQAQEVMAAYQQEMRPKREAARIKLAEKNRAEGEKFLAENKPKEGIKTHPVKLPDGSAAELQYKILTEGTGETPKATDTVNFNFRGKLINGTEFDNSAKYGPQLTKFAVNRIPIRGMSEAMQLMKTGSKWEIYVPSSLAFGDVANGSVEPGATLIYEVELLGIDSPKPAVVAAPPKPLVSDTIKVPSAEDLKKGAQIEYIKSEDLEKFAQTNSPPPAKKP